MKPLITAYDWAPDEGQGLVRDMRVRWALEEVGQPYDVRLMHWGEQKEAAHRARNPFGQVPAYEDDQGGLFESGAIVLHVAQRWSGLLPDDPGGRGRAIAWMFAALNSVEPPVTDLVIAKFVENKQDWASARLPVVMDRLKTRLGELAKPLGDADWLDGDFSAGDLLMIHVLRNLSTEQLLDGHPTLAAYVARGEARPAFGRALATIRSDMTGHPPADWNQSTGEKQ